VTVRRPRVSRFQVRREAIRRTADPVRSRVRHELERPAELNPRPLIEYIVGLPLKSPRVVYNLACYYSLAVANGTGPDEEYLDIAFEYLRQSISRSPPRERRGLLEHANVDRDLDALRQARSEEINELQGLIPGEEVPPETEGGPDSLGHRRQEIRRVVDQAIAWAHEHPGVRGLGIAGSWARGEGRPDSDVDLIVLTTEPDQFTLSDEWLNAFGSPQVVRRRQSGAVTKRRVELPSGLKIEFGIAPPGRAGGDFLDAGTRRAIREGLRIIYDPDGQLGRLRKASAAG
jgi:hypothetical protein